MRGTFETPVTWSLCFQHSSLTIDHFILFMSYHKLWLLYSYTRTVLLKKNVWTDGNWNFYFYHFISAILSCFYMATCVVFRQSKWCWVKADFTLEDIKLSKHLGSRKCLSYFVSDNGNSETCSIALFFFTSTSIHSWVLADTDSKYRYH